jgi:transposase
MLKTSPYKIELTDDEGDRLEGTARCYTSPCHIAVRAKIVLLAAFGLRNDEIAPRLGTPRQIVSKWRKRFYEQRLAGLQEHPRSGRPRLPPEVVVAIKALACELPAKSSVPLARWHAPDLARTTIEQGIIVSISDTTIWRWLSADAIHRWQHRSWIFPRDPDFAKKAGRVLDLYQRRFGGEPLGESDFVVCAYEKTSIQARLRKHPTVSPTPGGRVTRLEHEYERGGALAYLSTWDVHRARIFGRCEPKNGIEPFARLVVQIMSVEPHVSAERVFWIVDNGTSHRGQASIDRLRSAFSKLVLVHLPVHASWLN